MVGIILVGKINITFQKVPDNFASMQKLHYFLTLMSVCLCLSPQNSAVTSDLLDRPVQNFQGALYSAQVIFGLVTWTSGPWDQP